MFTNSGVQRASVEIWGANRPLNRQIDLGEGVSVAPVLRSVADYVFRLCDPHGLTTAPTRTFQALYSFIKDDDADETAYAWDSGRRIEMAVALSRLVHPTTIGFEYSARLFLNDAQTDVDEAVVGPFKGPGAAAYLAEASRDWLTDAEAVATGDLLQAFYEGEDGRPHRINRAIRFHEYAARSDQLENRWVLIVTALESLINVEVRDQSRQFRTRTVQLAEACGAPWTDAEAREAYRLRSKLTHGQPVTDPGAEGLQLYRNLESVLRSALTRAILEQDFAANFSSDDQIQAAWPLG